MKKNAVITTALFAAVLGGLSLLNALAPSRVFSQNENRYLQQLPELSLTVLMNGSYTAGLDTYVTDQFAFRDVWVGGKALCERLLGKGSSNGIYFAGDGYLIEMFDELDRKMWERNLGYLERFSENAATLGVPSYVMLTPSASLALADKLPPFAPELDQRALLREAAEVLPGFVDVGDALAAHSDEYIYYKTDHHWTSLGAFYAYNAWRVQKGLSEKTIEDYRRETLSTGFYGTTYSKASLYTVEADTITAFEPVAPGQITVEYNNGEIVTDTLYERSYLEVKDKYSVFLNANQPVVHITTQNDNDKRLLIIKDSYANAFAQLLLSDYEEIFILDLRYYKQSVKDYMEQNRINEALVLYSLKGFSTDSNLFFITKSMSST